MKIPENIFRHIQTEADRIHYGEITIEVNDDKNKIDVVTKQRKRFHKEEVEKEERPDSTKPREERRG